MFVRKFKNRIAPISFGLGATVAYFMGCLWWPTKFVSGVAIPSFSTGYYALAGPLYIVFPVLYGIFAGAGLWELIRQLDQFAGHRKSQLNLLLWGFIFGFSGGGTTFFGVFGFHIAPFGVPGVVLYECLVAYAITKHELMGIKIVINKAGAFLVTTLIFGLAYLGLILPYRTYVSTSIDLPFVVLSSAYCIAAVGLYFHRVQRFLQTSAYKKFLKFDYDFDETLKSVSSKLILAQNTADVIDTMMLMQDSLEIGQCYAFLRKDETSSEFECYRIERTKNDQEKPDKTLLGTYDASHPFLAWLEEHFDKVKRIETLDVEAQKFLETLGVSADSICMSIDSFKAFQAVFIIGQRLNEERYQDKDLALFEVIANQAVIVFERITQARRLMGQQAKLEKLNAQLQASNIELESKVKEAVALAQKHFHQAAFATLTSGMAHEIRNPMAAILGTAQFLAEAMDARYESTSNPSPGQAPVMWCRPITSDDFVGLLNGDQEKAAAIFKALVDHGFISPEGALTDQVDIVSGDMANVDLGPSFAGDAVFIESMMKRLAQTSLLIEFINVVSHHIPRLLEITETMMRYGISGGGIKVDTFTKIIGITAEDSVLIFDVLRSLDYLDERGGVLPKFNLNDPGIDTVVAGYFPSHLQRFSRDIVKVVQSTPGAVKQALSILEVLQNTLTLIEGSCHKKHIAVHREFDRDLPLIAGDAHRLQQAFFNIVFNAVQAMDGQERDRRLTVRVACTQFPVVGGNLVDGIEIQFEDTGPGISPETKANIFNPFFTTKDPTGGKNVGLGLSILYEVISGHGGYIDVESELDKGTVFKVVLPRWVGGMSATAE